MTFTQQPLDSDIERTIFFIRPGNSLQVSGRSCVTLNLVIRLLTNHWSSSCSPYLRSSTRAHMKVNRSSGGPFDIFCRRSLSHEKRVESRSGTQPHSPSSERRSVFTDCLWKLMSLLTSLLIERQCCQRA